MAGVSIWPDVVDALILLSKDRVDDTVLVLDGDGSEDQDVFDFLFVGLGDPRRDDSDAGTFDQTWPQSTTAGRRETGTVFCIAISYNGDGDVKAARDSAFATLGAVQRLLREDTRLGGVNGLLSTSLTGGQPDQRQTSRGAVCAVRFSVDYTADLRE